jgi:hypothetical protein
MRVRNLVVMLTAVLATAGLAACGGSGKTTDAGHSAPDTGPTVQCYTDWDCLLGNCSEKGACVHCSANSCSGGQYCASDFKCTGCDGSCFPADAGPTPCKLRADCPAAQVCHNQTCQAPDPTGRCASSEECPTGQVCNWTAGVCMVGCTNNSDCSGVVLDGGLPAPHCDTAVSNQCTQCVDSNDCDIAKGEVCSALDDAGTIHRCVQAPQCVPPNNTPCQDHVCLALDGGGFGCGPCTSATQCSDPKAYDCTGGKCVLKSTGCTSDDQCKAHGMLGNICNNGECDWGCLPDDPDAGANCYQWCCNPDAGQACNTATHQCSGGQACDDCNPPCNMGDTCDTSTCSCISGSSTDGGGMLPGQCDPTSCVGCEAGQTCKCYDIYACSPGTGCLDNPIMAPFAMCE